MKCGNIKIHHFAHLEAHPDKSEYKIIKESTK